jgi:hypothetical protein
MIRQILILLFSTSIVTAQMTNPIDFKAIEKEDGVYIYFKNNNSDGFYLDGEFFDSYGKIVLPKEEFISMLEAAAKLVKKTEGSVKREKYSLDKFSFEDDVVYFGVKEKIGSLTKDKIKELRRRYED